MVYGYIGQKLKKLAHIFTSYLKLKATDRQLQFFNLSNNNFFNQKKPVKSGFTGLLSIIKFILERALHCLPNAEFAAI
jgi:hypothetical protein